MSFRFYVSGTNTKMYQVLGNNEWSEHIEIFLKQDGLILEDNWECFYDYELKNFNGLLDSLILYLKDLEELNKNIYENYTSIYDLTPNQEAHYQKWDIRGLVDLHKYSYIMAIPNLIEFLKEDIEGFWCRDDNTYKYRVRKDSTIKLSFF